MLGQRSESTIMDKAVAASADERAHGNLGPTPFASVVAEQESKLQMAARELEQLRRQFFAQQVEVGDLRRQLTEVEKVNAQWADELRRSRAEWAGELQRARAQAADELKAVHEEWKS